MEDKFIQWIKSNLISVIGVFVGALGGFLYWYFIGCESGHCPIQGNPYMSTLYGALLGWLVFSSLKKK